MMQTTRLLLLAGLVTPALPVAADPVDDARDRAQEIEEDYVEPGIHRHATPAATDPPFRFRPNNGYPGTTVQLQIGGKYTVIEKGERRRKTLQQAAIDWGDGSPVVTVAPGGTVKHTYGHRDPDGGISPSNDRDYTGRITFYTLDGDAFTEGFEFVLWTEQDNRRRGGRLRPSQVEDAVPIPGNTTPREDKPAGGYHRPGSYGGEGR